ncbi:MAG: DUF192 domain-containing protein [Candidatus Micrarchaeaceae archaeon]
MAIFLNKTGYRKASLNMKGKRFTVEVADSFMKIMKGLMNHSGLPADGGMLFIFKSDRKYGFWMLNMKFSIDIIWLDKNCRVVYVWRNAIPCKSIFSCRTVKPDEDSRYVLEVRAGTASALRLRIGDRIKIGHYG